MIVNLPVVEPLGTVVTSSFFVAETMVEGTLLNCNLFSEIVGLKFSPLIVMVVPGASSVVGKPDVGEKELITGVGCCSLSRLQEDIDTNRLIKAAVTNKISLFIMCCLVENHCWLHAAK